MPIKIPESLPAKLTLEQENIFVMTEHRALHQDIRPLKIAILNIMPTKIATETQILRSLSNTPLQIEIDLLHTSTYTSKNTPSEHLTDFYKTFSEIKNTIYDGLIITGAPVENLDFRDVAYWDELCEILEWTKSNVFSTFHICWAAQAALFYHYGIEKHPVDNKVFGIFPHTVTDKKEPLLRGFDDIFYAPHSRHTAVNISDVEAHPALSVLSTSKEAGLYIAKSKDDRQIFVTGHSEYDAQTLELEYTRDRDRGLDIEVPRNYFIGDDPEKGIRVSWRAHGHLLYTNWLNYYVYQTTPYALGQF